MISTYELVTYISVISLMNDFKSICVRGLTTNYGKQLFLSDKTLECETVPEC